MSSPSALFWYTTGAAASHLPNWRRARSAEAPLVRLGGKALPWVRGRADAKPGYMWDGVGARAARVLRLSVCLDLALGTERHASITPHTRPPGGNKML